MMIGLVDKCNGHSLVDQTIFDFTNSKTQNTYKKPETAYFAFIVKKSHIHYNLS